MTLTRDLLRTAPRLTEAARRRPRPPRRPPLPVTVLGALLFAAGVVWLLLGLRDAADVVRAEATSARAELETFKAALTQGDSRAADQHLTAAGVHLAAADAAASRAQVRIVGLVPLLGWPADDLGHLLTAAHLVTDSGRDALTLYRDFSGTGPPLFARNRFDLAQLERVSSTGTRLSASLERARRELEAVHAGILAPAGVAEARNAGLRQVRELQDRVGGLGAGLSVLPDAVGLGKPRTYLLTILNPAELRPSGGAPLSIALLRFDKGRMTIENRGQTAELTRSAVQENPPLRWDGLDSDPWFPRYADRFANATMSPDWPTSAEELRRAYAVQFRTERPAGVIALDAVALAELLRVTGPIRSPGYGTLRADNLVQTLLVDAYTQFDTPASQSERRNLNNALIDAMVNRLAAGGHVLEKAKALGRAAQGRHFRLYFRDPSLQRLVATHRLDGALTSPIQDYLGVFTKNGNGSKIDVFERREIHQLVRLQPDGSARVTRTVVIGNEAPPSALGRRFTVGYFTRLLTSIVVDYVPRAGTGVRLAQNGTPVPDPLTLRDREWQAVIGSSQLWPGESATYSLTYTLPQPQHGGAYSLTIDPQPVVRTPSLRIDVFAPSREEFARARDWVVKGGHARWSGRLDRASTLSLRFA